ncbi:MAG: threonine-phosphate decarboxylase [Nitrospira sp.]|nr:threonine-phosphate decarboxylase [bacterium]MBL7048691.1 threonine-phosphate decarboxylase [Nitrospira sp.]
MMKVKATAVSHGGNVYRAAAELGLNCESLIDFSASINPLGVSDRVREAITSGVKQLVNYPDPESFELKNKIAALHGIDPDMVMCGNGSTELIYLLPRVIRPETVLITAPAFAEYERAVKISETKGHPVQIREYAPLRENLFQINTAAFKASMKGCDMAFLCNPGNPSGVLTRKEAVLEIAAAARDSRCYLVVDEAFIDCMPEESVVTDVRDNPYLIVLRSLTKFYALAGLRAGYAVFHADLADRVTAMKEPWTVNSLAQRASLAALADSEYAERSISLMNGEKIFMEEGLQDLGIEYFPSLANYYLLKLDNAQAVISHLKQRGILVRDCSNFKGLDSTYIRVAVKSRADNEKLLREMKLCAE